VPTIVRKGSIELKVYFSDAMRHHAPHFHVWDGGESVATVSLATLEPFIGGPLRKQVRRLASENLDALWEAWDECNPE
jgi:Domain of unknown function (DUF4160)